MSLRRALQGIDVEIFVVDNHSRDASVEYLMGRFPDVNYVSSNHNLGFARANNIAIRQCEGEYVLLLNPDTIVGEHTVGDVLDFMENHENAGGVGVRMLKPDGNNAMESRRGLPSPMVAFYKMCGLCTRYPRSRRFGHYYMSYLPWEEAARIEVISGAFCMLRRSALDKVGLLDEDFFMYGEDIDLSYRLIKGGFENWYYPSQILHYKGESTQKTSFRYVHVFYGAMLTFFRKHYKHISWILSFGIKSAIYAKAVVALGNIKIRQMRKVLGFVNTNRRQYPHYVFVGKQEMLDKCRLLAKRRYIDAEFHVGDAQSRPNGHADLQLPNADTIYVVYDVDAYRFEDIFKIFSAHPKSNVHLGTYYPQTGIVITPHEILN